MSDEKNIDEMKANIDEKDVDMTALSKLIKEDGDITEALQRALKSAFARFDVDKDGALNSEELNEFAIAVNGKVFEESALEEIKEYFSCNEQGHLLEEGFFQMYALQTNGDPEETLNDLKTLGITLDA